MFVIHALTRGAMSFVIIMSLGILALNLQDGLSPATIETIASLLDPETLLAGVDSLKESFQRSVQAFL